jgi:hypothetical protein
MQDYFKYDKIQRGAPLYMKSDSDGSTDKDKKGLPLGIKTTTEGIKHFTNWDNIANSIDVNKGLRFDDAQPNSLHFRMPNRNSTSVQQRINGTDLAKNALSTDKNYMTLPRYDGTSILDFRDKWEVSDINIVDDMAFVSYKDYTDIHKKTLSLAAGAYQNYSLAKSKLYGGISTSYIPKSNIVIQAVHNEIVPHQITPGFRSFADEDLEYPVSSVRMSNAFSSFDNCVLKVTFSASSNPDGTPITLYFTYGGTKQLDGGNFHGNDQYQYNIKSSYIRFSGTKTSSTKYINYSGNDGVVAGSFYSIPGNYYWDPAQPPTSSDSHYHTHLATGHSWQFFELSISGASIYGFPGTIDGDTVTDHIMDEYELTQYGIAQHNIRVDSIELIKFQPVRKCGKVDIYTRKRGIVNAIVGNRVTSPGHGLNTNDIVKISSALFDGTQTGAVDIHPLNGDKFVKVIDVDTFDLYEDQFFENAVSTNRLKTTDGITWSCVSNANGDFGQSWDYHKTLFSPTGRNGYLSWSGDVNDLAHPYANESSFTADSSSFTTDKRIKSVKKQQTDDTNDNFGHSINLDFQSITTEYIKEILENIPENQFGRSPFDLAVNGPQQYFPYHCVDDGEQSAVSYLDNRSPYSGNQFGCALDAKFSHMSGDSKVYTLAIGEKGSDVSVDFLGMTQAEYSVDGSIPYYVETTTSSTFVDRKYLNPFYKQRVVPYFYPHGKVHVLSITVDKYGKITDISHKNTLFGDGGNTLANITSHGSPWRQASRIATSYRSFIANSYLTYVFDFVIDTRKSDQQIIPTFNESFDLISDKSLYWDRAAIAHWFGGVIYDYFNTTTGSTGSLTLSRNYQAQRNSATVNTDLGEKTRFGTDNIRIDRFNISGQNADSQWYIYPWVDSFGKSVAIGDRDENGNISIFGASTSISNIDIDTTAHATLTDYLRPFGYGYNLTNDEENVQIGQITQLILNSDYNVSEVYEINGGGVVQSYPNLSPANNIINRSGGNFITLKDGPTAGDSKSSVYHSLHRSASKILLKDGYLMWADQIGGEQKSTINIFKINPYLQPHTSVSRDWNIESSILTDGFGVDIRYDGGLIVTNAMSNVNDLGEPIGGRYDVLMLYHLNKNTGQTSFLQQISPTFSSEDEDRYPERLLKDYEDSIIDINNVNYDGDIIKSKTWNIRLAGKYDVFDDNILLRDPIEFCLFSKDLSVDRLTYSPEKISESESAILPYFSFVEHFKNNTVYYDYAAKNEIVVQDKNTWSISGANTIQNSDNIVSTPVFFLDIPSLGGIDRYGNLTVKIRINTSGRTVLESINNDFSSSTTLIDNNDPIVPKLILYGKDPRSMIVPNGPSATGSNTEITPFTNGIFTSQPGTLVSTDTNYRQAITQPPLFRGGANDLYFYGSLAGSTPQLTSQNYSRIFSTDDYLDSNKDFIKRYWGGGKTLGELFDISYNKAGNTDKGIISWATLSDTITSVDQNNQDIFPYAALISGATSLGNDYYEFTIPYETWKNYIVRGHHIKSSDDNRPMFDGFTRIKHGTLSSRSPFSGTWAYDYDDANQPTYNPRTIISNGGTQEVLPSFTIAIGFLVTSVTSVDLRNDLTTTGSFYLTEGQNFRNPVTLKQPYSIILSGQTTQSDSVHLLRNNFYSHNLSTTINQIECKLSKTSYPNRRFKNVYHKVAFFECNNSAYDEVQKNMLSSVTDAVDRYAFGKYSFSPLPVGISRNLTRFHPDPLPPGYPPWQTTAGNSYFLGESYNPIIRVGKSEANSHNAGGNKGTFSKSVQVLTSDNIIAYGDDQYFTSNYYINDGDLENLYYNYPPTGAPLGGAYFAGNNLLGGFDIQEPEYLSLSISAVPTKNNYANLFTEGMVAVSGDTTIYVGGVESQKDNTTLWIGKRIRNTGIPLNISGPDTTKRMTLWTQEIAPSAIMPLTINTPDASGHLSLTFTPPGTGDTTLFIAGPTQTTGTAPLNIDGKAFNFGQTILFASGIGKSFKLAPLSIDGVYLADGGTTMHIGHIKHNDNTTLWAYGSVPNSGDIPLSIRGRGAFNAGLGFFTGTQYEFEDKHMSLMVKNIQKPLNANISTTIDGRVTSINSLTHGEGDYVLSRDDNLVDITSSSELPVNITINNTTTSYNSITTKSYSGAYSDKKITGNSVLKYFGSQPKSVLNKNPAYILKSLSSAGSKITAFYNDESLSDFNKGNALIKRETYDANGRIFIAANTNVSGGPLSLDIYDILYNQQIQFRSKLYINLCKNVPNTPESGDLDYARNGISDTPSGDSFVSLRRRLKEHFDSSFVNADLNLAECKILGQDLKISKLGTIALSLRVKLQYSNTSLTETRSFSVIILLHSSDVVGGDSSINIGLPTYYTEHYHYHIFEESGSLQNKISLAHNVVFDGEDLYFNKLTGQWGQIWKMPHAGNSTPTKAIDFGQLQDVDGYINSTNTFYINESDKRAGFGSTLKVFDDYSSAGGKIMFVGAPLFDPYTFNTLSGPHAPNPIGAVYIYKRALGATGWTYFGAVYGKGNTSDNVITNISDYRDSTINDQQYCLFGYDFDYSQGNLVVSEPGGDGPDEINTPKAYLFKINSSIELLTTYTASDIVMPDSSTLSSDDNYGSHIILLGPNNPVTYSDSDFGNGIIHYLKNNMTATSSIQYVESSSVTAAQAKQNLSNENKYYEDASLAGYNQDLITRGYRISSMKKLDFGDNQQRLVTVKTFTTRVETPIPSTLAFDLQKISILDVNREAFSLFISGPQATTDSITVAMDTIGRPSGNIPLSIRPIDRSNNLATLYVQQSQALASMPMHIETVRNNYAPMYITGTFVPVSGNMSLAIDAIPFTTNDTTIHVSGADYTTNVSTLQTQGTLIAENVKPATLFIGQNINANTNTSLYLFAGRAIPEGYTALSSGTLLAISGRASNIFDTNDNSTLFIPGPDSAQTTNTQPLYITTDIPDTGVAGFYKGSGNITTFIDGNNDGSVFTEFDKGTTLSIVSSIQNTGTAPLYIERPFANLMSLSIKNQNPSGVMTTFVSGAYIGSGNMTLTVAPPTAKTLPIQTRGFLE